MKNLHFHLRTLATTTSRAHTLHENRVHLYLFMSTTSIHRIKLLFPIYRLSSEITNPINGSIISTDYSQPLYREVVHGLTR
jgi:hypothetical protein